MRTRRVRALGLLAAAGALVLAAGCSSGGTTTGTGSTADTGTATGGGAAAGGGVEKPDLTVAAVPAVDSAGFFIALYQGLFQAQGLHVKFVPAISSETAIADQVKGVYDISCGNYVSYVQAQQEHRADLDIFAEGSLMQPGSVAIYTMPNSPIRTLEDLKGKTIGINAPDNILFLLAASVLSEHGISPDQVHFIVPNGGFPAMPADLRDGFINAAVLPEPFASIAQQADGAVPLADLNQGATTGFPVEGYVVTKQWARKYPRTLAAFYRALEQGQRIADTDRAAVEAAMESLPKPLGLDKQTAAILALANYPVSAGPVGSVDEIRLKRVTDVMQQFIRFPSFNIGSMLMGG